MDRRNFIAAAAGGIATAATGVLSSIAIGSEGAVSNDLIVRDPRILAQMKVVAKAAWDCVAAAHACVQHCQEEFLAGNVKDFANCSVAAHQMIPVCENTAILASYKAKSLADFLDGCIKACETCRVACKEHEAHFAHGMHQECKRCMETCLACRDACQALKAML